MKAVLKLPEFVKLGETQDIAFVELRSSFGFLLTRARLAYGLYRFLPFYFFSARVANKISKITN